MIHCVSDKKREPGILILKSLISQPLLLHISSEYLPYRGHFKKIGIQAVALTSSVVSELQIFHTCHI